MDLLIQFVTQIIEWIYQCCGDYGVAIVVVTVAIRFCLIPLNINQRKQMQKQQELSKEIEQIKEKYKNNETKMNEAIQKLYQEKGMGGTGCLLSLVQLPIMWCLYRAIQVTATVGATSILLPWVSSLLVRDQTLLLPLATLVIQFLPQIYPYLHYFKKLNLPKQPVAMIAPMFISNGIFVLMLPAGVGLYYFISGLFTAVEQLITNLMRVKREKILA